MSSRGALGSSSRVRSSDTWGVTTYVCVCGSLLLPPTHVLLPGSHLSSVAYLSSKWSSYVVMSCHGFLLTGRTLRVWRGGKCAASLSGHLGPVLCLLVLPGGEILSGSGDTSVKMWAPGAGPCIHTIKAHTDTVR